MTSGAGPHPAGMIARYALLGAALGAPIGVLWAWWAPRVVVASLSGANFVDPYPQGFAEADLILGALLLVAGCGIGAAAALRLRRTAFHRGWAHVIGAVAGAAMCAAVARIIGWWLVGRSPVALPDGSFGLPVSIGANGVLLLGAFSALLVIVVFAAFAREPLRTSTERSGPSSPRSGPPA